MILKLKRSSKKHEQSMNLQENEVLSRVFKATTFKVNDEGILRRWRQSSETIARALRGCQVREKEPRGGALSFLLSFRRKILQENICVRKGGSQTHTYIYKCTTCLFLLQDLFPLVSPLCLSSNLSLFFSLSLSL